MRHNVFFLLLFLVVFCSCQREMWFEGGLSSEGNKVDVFYLASTEVQQARTADGAVSLRAMLTTEDTAAMNSEFCFVRDSICRGDFNFYAPYYHQYTMESFVDYPEAMDSVRAAVGEEVCEIFDRYMKHVNHGRPYILAGFSQGGDMVMHILRHMSAEQHSRMVAAYVMGFSVTASDTADYATIRPAHGVDDTGVTIAYNSVLRDVEITDRTYAAIHHLVTDGTVVCINPVNWQTDTTSASFIYQNRPHRVQVDPERHVLVVDADSAFYPNGLHLYDLLFYTRFLHDNAILRSKKL